MFRATACRRLFAAGLSLGPGFLFLLVMSFVVFFCSDVHARRLRVNPITSIKFGVGLEYGKKWGDVMEGASFRQNYSMSVGGFALDPRLMVFNFTLHTGIQDNEGSYSKDYSVTGAGLRLVFFKGIDRDRGLKLWRYVPSPLKIMYNYATTGDYSMSNYGISMYYSRPGYIRFFGRGGIIYYDNGRTPAVKANKNRYRVKFKGNSLNDAGNGNWNNNGNGNGNGNWNRNGNGNWNRNGNGNWNKGASNVNTNAGANAGNYNQYASEAMGFSMPNISFDMIHGDYKYKNSRMGADNDYTSGNLRFEVNNQYPKRRGSNRYGAHYILSNSFYDSSSGNRNDLTLFMAQNQWDKFKLVNRIGKKNINQDSHLSYSLDADYVNTYRSVNYKVNLGGQYSEINDNYESYEYGLSASADTKLVSRRRLTPNLLSTTSGSLSLGREREVVQDGVRYPGRMLYSLGATEHLEYTRFNRYAIQSDLAVSYSESGVPFRFSLNGTTKKFLRWSINNLYQYRVFFPKAYGERSSSQDFSNTWNYIIRADLVTSHKLSYSTLIEEGGEAVNQDYVTYTGKFTWNISPRKYSDISCTVNKYDEYGVYSCLMHYKTRLNYSGYLALALQSNWNDVIDGTDDKFIANYSWRYRQFVSAVDYFYRVAPAGGEEHNIWLKVKRNFYLRMKRFY